MNIHILTHDFQKQNLVTVTRGKKIYDKVKCSRCGLEGIRYGLSNHVVVKYDKKCFTSKKVKMMSQCACKNFGFEMGKNYGVVPCPTDQAEKFAKDVWIYSEQRKEPVRLLPGEYIYV